MICPKCNIDVKPTIHAMDVVCPECWSPLYKISHDLSRNEILDDLPMVKSVGTGTNKHRTTIRTGLPAVAWRRLNVNIAYDYHRLMQKFNSLYDYEYQTLMGKISSWFTRDSEFHTHPAAVIEVAIVSLVVAAFAIYEILKN